MLRYADGNGNERNKINKEEAWSDGKCGREVKDKDYYSRSEAQISTWKALATTMLIIMLIIFIFCNMLPSLNVWRIFWWKLEFRYLCEVLDPLTYISNWATALILLVIALLSSCCSCSLNIVVHCLILSSPKTVLCVITMVILWIVMDFTKVKQ